MTGRLTTKRRVTTNPRSLKNLRPKIGVGSEVRLKTAIAGRGYRQRSVVIGGIPGIEGGLILADYLDGMRCWNVEDLELYVKPR